MPHYLPPTTSRDMRRTWVSDRICRYIKYKVTSIQSQHIYDNHILQNSIWHFNTINIWRRYFSICVYMCLYSLCIEYLLFSEFICLQHFSHTCPTNVQTQPLQPVVQRSRVSLTCSSSSSCYRQGQTANKCMNISKKSTCIFYGFKQQPNVPLHLPLVVPIYSIAISTPWGWGWACSRAAIRS